MAKKRIKGTLVFMLLSAVMETAFKKVISKIDDPEVSELMMEMLSPVSDSVKVFTDKDPDNAKQLSEVWMSALAKGRLLDILFAEMEQRLDSLDLSEEVKPLLKIVMDLAEKLVGALLDDIEPNGIQISRIVEDEFFDGDNIDKVIEALLAIMTKREAGQDSDASAKNLLNRLK